MPKASFAFEGKDFQAAIGIGSYNGTHAQLTIGWVSQRSQEAPLPSRLELPAMPEGPVVAESKKLQVAIGILGHLEHDDRLMHSSKEVTQRSPL